MVSISLITLAVFGLSLVLFGRDDEELEISQEAPPHIPEEVDYTALETDQSSSLVGTSGNDLMIGADNDQQFVSGGGDDTLVAYGGNDSISADGGRDFISAGAGDDRVFAGTGFDTVFGEEGNDRLFGRGGNDRLFGGEGNDTMSGEQGHDRLRDSQGEDILIGNSGNDTLIAFDIELGASDRLLGGDGNDMLSGDDGDTLTGGAGDDEFRIAIDLQNEPVVISDLFYLGDASTPGQEQVFFMTEAGEEVDGDHIARNLLVVPAPDGGSTLMYAGDAIALVRGIEPELLNLDSGWIGNFG